MHLSNLVWSLRTFEKAKTKLQFYMTMYEKETGCQMSFVGNHFNELTSNISLMLGLPTSMMSLRVSLALPLISWFASENEAETFRTKFSTNVRTKLRIHVLKGFVLTRLE